MLNRKQGQQKLRGGAASSQPDSAGQAFDFRSADRLPESQMSAIEALQGQFVEAVTAGLSVYLRTFVSGRVLGIRQAPFSEFIESLPNPTGMACLTMRPYSGNAIAEINQGLLAPLLDLVLGGNGNIRTEINREITDVEAHMLDGVLRILIQALNQVWNTVLPIDLALDRIETKPLAFRRIAPEEAVVWVSIELQLRDAAGTVNIALPVTALKMMRGGFEQQAGTQPTYSRETEQAIKDKLARELRLDVACELHGAGIRLRDLMDLSKGQVIDLCIPSDGSATIVVAGKAKFRCVVGSEGPHLSATIRSLIPPA